MLEHPRTIDVEHKQSKCVAFPISVNFPFLGEVYIVKDIPNSKCVRQLIEHWKEFFLKAKQSNIDQ